MTKTITKTLLVVLLSLVTSTALSQTSQGQNNDNQGQNTVSAPEFDPTHAMGALALLAGTVAVLRGYRRRQK